MRVPGLDRALQCTITIGVSQHFADASALEAAMRQADAALYQGKAAGRNRVEVMQAAYSNQFMVSRELTPAHRLCHGLLEPARASGAVPLNQKLW